MSEDKLCVHYKLTYKSCLSLRNFALHSAKSTAEEIDNPIDETLLPNSGVNLLPIDTIEFTQDSSMSKSFNV